MAEGFTYAAATEILKSKITSSTYVCLSTTTPTKTGANFTEPAASTGYSRKAFGSVNSSKTAQVTNSEIIFLFESLEDVGSITHVGLATSLTATPFLIAALDEPLTVTAGYVPLIRAKKFVVGLDKEALESYD